MIKLFLRPFSYLYAQVGNARNALYDRGWQKTIKLQKPVISVGNLTVGGTGKTPLTDLIIRKLIHKNKKVAVISRAYRAQAKAPVKVDPFLPDAARKFGDEPVLLAQRNPEIAVYVGASKWQIGLFAQKDGDYDVFVVDDGYQHRRLHRDLNVVILDATEKPENYAVVPEGRSRETWSGLLRSDLIILSKSNLADDETLRWIEARLPQGISSYHVGYGISCIQNVDGQKIVNLELADKEVFLVSAIARPDVFESMVRNIAKVAKGSLVYRDHHQYTSEDVKSITQAFERSGADYLLTTQKDAVKLLPLLQDKSKLWVAPLEIDLMNAERGIDAALDKIIR